MLKEDLKQAKNLLYTCRDLVGGPGSGGLLSLIDEKLAEVAIRTKEYSDAPEHEQIMETAVHEHRLSMKNIGSERFGPVLILAPVNTPFNPHVSLNDIFAITKNAFA